MIEDVWEVTGPLDLRRSLRFSLPKAVATARLSRSECSYTLATAEGAATVRVSFGEGLLRARALGPGAEMALATVRRTVGLDDDPTLFPATEGPIRDLHRRYRGVRLGSTGRIFDTVLPAIIGQRVTTEEATDSYRRLCAALGTAAPGDEALFVSPTPHSLADLDYSDFHAFGIERSRAGIIIEAARRAGRLEAANGMERADAVRRLGAIRGIGPWTIGQVMGAGWGDRDAVPWGDHHLPNSVAWLLAGEPRGDDERMEALLEDFRPNRRRALILVKLSGVTAPRYGPRSARSVISDY